MIGYLINYLIIKLAFDVKAPAIFRRFEVPKCKSKTATLIFASVVARNKIVAL
jgi:hypothetical protein